MSKSGERPYQNVANGDLMDEIKARIDDGDLEAMLLDVSTGRSYLGNGLMEERRDLGPEVVFSLMFPSLDFDVDRVSHHQIVEILSDMEDGQFRSFRTAMLENMQISITDAVQKTMQALAPKDE